MSDKETVTKRFSNFAKQEYDELKRGGEKRPYNKFSYILNMVKESFKDDSHFLNVKDVEQSWKTILGGVLESLIEHSLEKELDGIGLKCLKPTKSNLGKNYMEMARQLEVQIGDTKIIPDADRVICIPTPFTVIAILSIKKKFRERIAQVGYWTIQMRKAMKPIKNVMVTTDEDKTFSKQNNKKKAEKVKAKAIAHAHTNGVFVATEAEIEENGKIKYFSKLIAELEKIKQDFMNTINVAAV